MTRVLTLNLGNASDSRLLRDLDSFVADGVTVMGLQEAGDRRDLLDDFLDAHPTWRIHAPRLPGAPSVPILWDAAEWQPLRFRSVLAVAARFVGPGAGPRRAKDKPVNVLAARHRRTGKRRRFLNTHFIASAGRKGPQYNARRSHFRDQAKVLGRMIAGRVPWTVVTGDFNGEFDMPELSAVRATGITGWTREGTHGRRPIDHVLGPAGGRDVVVTASDHDAVVADLF